ncbi:uncharacterized protein LOC127812928 [Diospyros lotus]|uniref:uncharacterized protein LOC127812928 n=1 Tax=Diospyros lotus TaxID=55363 RepID=UPI00224F39F5|nr:uncharacterized protein LOC127812928 [Diospyros lotus]
MAGRLSSRMKEEERIERIIRDLLKLPENRRCINCNSLGPQYVCTTFWTFVCTTCSGVHREFTHRVKSVSMAKFNAEEVSALQAGGNERARQIYFKEWDPQRNPLPDGSNQNRLRDFIKNVYADRKFTGERSVSKLAMVKAGARESSTGRSSFERLNPGAWNDDRSSRRYIDDERSPRYKPDNLRSSSHRSRPANFEIVDDRFRDDDFGSGRRSETRRPSTAESRTGSRSPVTQQKREKTSTLVLRPVRDILGENAVSLQVGESPKANERRNNECSARGQKTVVSTDPGSIYEKSPEHKGVNSSCLIDFGTDPEPPNPAAEQQLQQTALSTDGGNGSSVQSSSNASNLNSLEFMLFGLSTPAAGPVDITYEAPGKANAPLAAAVVSSNIEGPTLTASTANPPPAVSSATSIVEMAPIRPNCSNNSSATVSDGLQLAIVPQVESDLSASGDSGFATQQPTPSVGYDQSWTLSLAPIAYGSSNASAEESSQASSKMSEATTSGIGSQELPAETNSSGRTELPVDIFTSSYSPFSATVPSWQIPAPYRVGFNMQHHPAAMPAPAFPSSGKSRNPFDLNDQGPEAQAQAPVFPSMWPLQGPLPNFSAPATSPFTSSTYSARLMQHQVTPYTSMAYPNMPSYGIPPTPVSGAMVGQQLPSNVPLARQQEADTSSKVEDAFASLNPIQQHSSSRYSTPTPPNSFPSAGGNPFG